MAMCAANLNAVGKGIQLHMTDTEQFPLLRREGGDLMEALNANSDSDDIENLNHNAMQNVWVMIKDNTLWEGLFKCPSDRQYKPRMETAAGRAPRKYGWNSWSNFSYGMHKPYGGPDHESPLSTKLAGSFPIFADKNYQASGRPGTVEYQSADVSTAPGNHPRNGFNWLTMGSSVFKREYNESTPGMRFSACGINDDDLYVAQDNDGTAPGVTDPTADPNSDTDSFILPWRPDSQP